VKRGSRWWRGSRPAAPSASAERRARNRRLHTRRRASCGSRPGAQGQDVRENRVGHRRFRIFGSGRVAAPAVEQQHFVVVGGRSRCLLAHVVRHQQVDALALSLARAFTATSLVSGRSRRRTRWSAARTRRGCRGSRQLERDVALALDLHHRRLLDAIVATAAALMTIVARPRWWSTPRASPRRSGRHEHRPAAA